MQEPRGMPNIGSTCYLNALIQALVGSEIFLANIEGELKQAFYTLDPTPFMNYLPKEPFDSHEAFIILLDKLPMKIFELIYSSNKDKLTQYVLMDPNFEFSTPEKSYTLINVPKLIVSHTILDPKFVYQKQTIDQLKDQLNSNMSAFQSVGPRSCKPLIEGKKYRLVSFVDHLGGHYVCNSIRDKKAYRFDDNSFIESTMTPNEKTVLFFYELVCGFALSPNPFQVIHPI